MTFIELCHIKIHGKSIDGADDAVKEIGRLEDLAARTEWVLSFRDRGMGHGDYGISATLEGEDILLFESPARSLAEHVINLHNTSI
jgi:hypothetical protein